MITDDIREAITIYFVIGLSYRDIVRMLAIEHGVVLSLRHLKRLLRELGLFRRKNYSDIRDVVDFVHAQIQTSGKLHGYRWMHEKCLLYNLHCKVEDVRVILAVLDPEGNAQRRKRRLLRRSYSSKGPNYLWHLDSYDKLKRYGLCINGCVDGFSRKIVWMNAYYTNSDPKIIGGYFVEAVKSRGGCPRVLRGDAGTENAYVRDMQRFLRMEDNDAMAGDSSYLQGRSTANQRIEYWWSFLRRECTDFWICLFRQMLDDGDFSGDFLDVNLGDLDDTVATWNQHSIRPSRNAHSPSGRPNVMYYMPELYGTVDYLSPMSEVRIQACQDECAFRAKIPCDKDVYDLCCRLISDNGYQFPQDSESALDLYIELKREILTMM